MAITTIIPPIPVIQSGSAKTGAHKHTCYRNNHQWDCQYSVSCVLEMQVGGQSIIDEMCPGCHMLSHNNYAK